MPTKIIGVELGAFEDNMAAFEVALLLRRNGREDEAQHLLSEIRTTIEENLEPKSVRALLPFVERALKGSKAPAIQPAAPCADGQCKCQRSWEAKALKAVLSFLFAVDLAAVVIIVVSEIAHRTW